MRKAVLFDEFAYQCPFFTGGLERNGGYGCTHPGQEDKEEGEAAGGCHCHTCPLGIEAEQEDMTEPEHPDAIKDGIDWDGLCGSREVLEGEYLLVDIGDTATEDEKTALYCYERYMHRYDEEWLDTHDSRTHLAD